MSNSNFIDSDGHLVKTSSMVDEHQIIKIVEKTPTIQNIGKIVSGDVNSNILTFEINRYYDGVDLYTKNIKFIVKNELGTFTEDAVNLQYNNELIRFSWILSDYVTQKSGNVTAAIIFLGTESNHNYALKTIPFSVKIESSLEFLNADEPTYKDWFADIEARIYELEHNSSSSEQTWHSHENKNVLDKLDASEDEKLLYNGKALAFVDGNTDIRPSIGWFEIINKECSTIPNSAPIRNSHFRGQDLTALGIEEIIRRIHNNFEDLFIGDYFDCTIDTKYGTEVVRNVIAGFDLYYMVGSEMIKIHHLVIIPKNCFTKKASMQGSNVAAGGYWGSVMNAITLINYASALQTALNSHIITHKHLITSAISETYKSMSGADMIGCATKHEWYDLDLMLLSEAQVYGTNNFSSSAYDGCIDHFQFPIFQLNPSFKICKLGGTDDATEDERTAYWLKNVSYKMGYAYVTLAGAAGTNNATANIGIRPFYLIG